MALLRAKGAVLPPRQYIFQYGLDETLTFALLTQPGWSKEPKFGFIDSKQLIFKACGSYFLVLGLL